MMIRNCWKERKKERDGKDGRRVRKPHHLMSLGRSRIMMTMIKGNSYNDSMQKGSPSYLHGIYRASFASVQCNSRHQLDQSFKVFLIATIIIIIVQSLTAIHLSFYLSTLSPLYHSNIQTYTHKTLFNHHLTIINHNADVKLKHETFHSLYH